MKKFLFIIILNSVTQILFAQEKLSLQQAIEIGLKNNYSIVIAKNESEIAKNNATPGNAGQLPTLDLGLTKEYNIIDSKQKYSDGAEVDKNGATANSMNANALLNWTIFDGFKMFASHKKLQELEAMGSLSSKILIENALSQIIVTYYNVVRQKQLINGKK